jgi:hypothetical protein
VVTVFAQVRILAITRRAALTRLPIARTLAPATGSTIGLSGAVRGPIRYRLPMLGTLGLALRMTLHLSVTAAWPSRDEFRGLSGSAACSRTEYGASCSS